MFPIYILNEVSQKLNAFVCGLQNKFASWIKFMDFCACN